MIELIDGAIKANTIFLGINLLMLVGFLYSWYSMYKKTGMNLDIWNYNMFLIFVIPFVLMYPFAESVYNIIYVGDSGLIGIEDGIKEAYIVSAIGFTSMFLGKYYYEKIGFNTIVNYVFYRPFMKTMGLYYTRITFNANVSRITALIYILVLTVFVTFTISQGFGSNPRLFFMANTQFRPFYNFITSLFSVVFGILTTRILHFGKNTDKFLLAPVMVFGFFLGVRAPVIFQTLNFGLMYVIYKRKGYIPIYKMVLFIVIILLLVIVLVVIRNGESSTGRDSLNPFSVFALEILYGNTFSDLRDFSWLLGYWNRAKLWGMSYISAFLSFIPSFLMPFREKWGIGKITVNILGFDSSIHPGLRPGFFGEMYFNFGILGVIVLGFVWAQVLQKVNRTVKNSISSNNVILGNSAIVASNFVYYLSNSAGFFGFYVLFGSLFVLYMCTRVKFNFSK